MAKSPTAAQAQGKTQTTALTKAAPVNMTDMAAKSMDIATSLCKVLPQAIAASKESSDLSNQAIRDEFNYCKKVWDDPNSSKEEKADACQRWDSAHSNADRKAAEDRKYVIALTTRIAICTSVTIVGSAYCISKNAA